MVFMSTVAVFLTFSCGYSTATMTHWAHTLNSVSHLCITQLTAESERWWPYFLSRNWLIYCEDSILMCLQLHTSHWCVCPWILLGNTRLNSLAWKSIVSCSGFVIGCFVVCLGPWITHLPQYVSPLFSKPILNRLVCKFGRMDKGLHT